MTGSESFGSRVTLCSDGKYRWIYEYPMMKRPGLLFTIWKVLALAGLAPALVTVLSDIGRDGALALVNGLKVYAVVILITGILSLAAYLITAAVYGWKYTVVFVMDNEGIIHAQQQRQFDKAQAIGIITALAGTAVRNPQVTGAGLLASSRSSIRSEFSKVKTVRGDEKNCVIRLNEPFAKNQIYVEGEDYSFVWSFITSRCPDANIIQQ